jgi:hypothetical protein
MILPTKHIPTSHSLLGVGARVLAALERPRTLVSLWDHLREQPEVGTFARLVLALDMLYAIEAVDLEGGLLHRRGSQ